MTVPYNYKNCQSLFGYAFHVHLRSRGTCELCGCGGPNLTFDLWRQMTVEHLIGKKQGGYLKDIRLAVKERFPDLAIAEQEQISQRIDEANTVTACSFCNSTTSQNFCRVGMNELILESQGTPEEVIAQIAAVLRPILEQKRVEVRWKLDSVRKEFESRFLGAIPRLGAWGGSSAANPAE